MRVQKLSHDEKLFTLRISAAELQVELPWALFSVTGYFEQDKVGPFKAYNVSVMIPHNTSSMWHSVVLVCIESL